MGGWIVYIFVGQPVRVRAQHGKLERRYACMFDICLFRLLGRLQPYYNYVFWGMRRRC